MGHRQRFDGPGQVHHAVNRGVGKRVIFYDEVDRRRFILLLACAHRRGEIEVIAFCLMSNHYHLLVRSERGTLSKAMKRIQSDYVRWFNRRHKRDGPLFRGRFKSRPVTSVAYFLVAIHYIDHNPVEAGLCDHPYDYPWGSAWMYATGRKPPWLTVAPVHSEVDLYRRPGESIEACYRRLFSAPATASAAFVRAERGSCRESARSLDGLLRASPARVRRWITARLARADGSRPWSVIAAPDEVRAAVRELSANQTLRVCLGRKRTDAWRVLVVSTLYLLAGQSQAAIALEEGVSQPTVGRLVQQHRWLVEHDDDYANAAAAVTSRAARRTFACVLPSKRE